MSLVRYLYVTNFITGGAVMVVELLGTRFLAPYFGSSVYTWTALITVTLVALAVGYRMGGALADKFPRAGFLYGLILAAALFLLAVLAIRRTILAASLGGGIIGGTLASATALFGLPLLILGTVAPYSVKLCAREMAHLGNVVGRLYAISTVGSFVGTVSAGFLLLPSFSNVSILAFCAGLLALPPIGYFLFLGRDLVPAGTSTLVLLIALLAGLSAEKLPRGKLPAYGLEWKAVYQTNSFYGRIRVIDLRYPGSESWSRRYLLNDGLIQGSYSLKEHMPMAPFPYMLTELVLDSPQPVRKALVLGLGAGFVPKLLHRYLKEVGTLRKIVTVEINPMMYHVAVRYFDFPDHEKWRSECPVVFADARTFVRNCKEKFDAIVVDTFLGDNAPTHLLSYEMFSQLRRILEPTGRMSINIFGSMRGPGSRLIAALVRTLRRGPDGKGGPFPFVQIFSQAATAVPHNVYILAGPAGTRPHGKELKAIRVPAFAGDEVRASLRDTTAELAGVDRAPVLTDDFNPAESLDAYVRLRIRENVRLYWGTALAE